MSLEDEFLFELRKWDLVLVGFGVAILHIASFIHVLLLFSLCLFVAAAEKLIIHETDTHLYLLVVTFNVIVSDSLDCEIS